MKDTKDHIVALWAIAIMVVIWIVWASFAIDSRLDKLECQEDMACWDCETMGNLICGGE